MNPDKSGNAQAQWQAVVEAERRKCGSLLIALARCRGRYGALYRAAFDHPTKETSNAQDATERTGGPLDGKP